MTSAEGLDSPKQKKDKKTVYSPIAFCAKRRPNGTSSIYRKSGCQVIVALFADDYNFYAAIAGSAFRGLVRGRWPICTIA